MEMAVEMDIGEKESRKHTDGTALAKHEHLSGAGAERRVARARRDGMDRLPKLCRE
jgi:hypothetical protein